MSQDLVNNFHFHDKQQERLNFLMYQLKSFLERNNIVIDKWNDNIFYFTNHDVFQKVC